MFTSTVTQKSIARKVANATGIEYLAALALVSETISDLGIKRVEYHQGIRSWMVSAADARALVEHLVEEATR